MRAVCLSAAAVLSLVGSDGSAQDPNTLDDDRYGLSVGAQAPSREAVFRLRSEDEFIAGLGRDFAERYPDEVFLRPVPADRFDRPDAATLGASWFQNRRTGAGRDAQGRRGDMGIESRAGVLPAERFEAAVLNEATTADSIVLGVDVRLADDAGRFGVLFGARDPDQSLEPVDQREWNTFHFAWASRDAVAVGRSAAGRQTVLAETPVAPRGEFRLEVVVHRGRVAVKRDGETVVELALDRAITERYAGVIGHSGSRAVRFDNFSATGYGGTLEARAFAPSPRGFPAPGVRYRPIYFEHVGIERYGHHLGNLIQPPLEHGAFFLDAAMLPLRVLHEPPWECQSDVGYCRPGDIVWPPRLSFPDW